MAGSHGLSGWRDGRQSPENNLVPDHDHPGGLGLITPNLCIIAPSRSWQMGRPEPLGEKQWAGRRMRMEPRDRDGTRQPLRSARFMHAKTSKACLLLPFPAESRMS